MQALGRIKCRLRKRLFPQYLGLRETSPFKDDQRTHQLSSFYYQWVGWHWDNSVFPTCVSKVPLRKMRRLDPQWVRLDDRTETWPPIPAWKTYATPLQMAVPSSSLLLRNLSAWALGARQWSALLILTTLSGNGLMLYKASACIFWNLESSGSPIRLSPP